MTRNTRRSFGRTTVCVVRDDSHLYNIHFFYPGHYHGNDVETPQRVSDIRAICEGVLDGTKTPVIGSNRSLPNMVEENGVKVNFSTPR